MEQKARAASDSGVRFRAELDIPADIQLPGVELCAVFSNLLDNALNACAQSPDGQRRVEATARLWGMYLVIDVENSANTLTTGDTRFQMSTRPDSATITDMSISSVK